jgi:CheY-like chemotaxis protein
MILMRVAQPKYTNEEGIIVRREAEHAHPAPKDYSKPECIPKSTSETAHLLRDRLSAQLPPGKFSSPTDGRLTPILLVQDYGGDSRSIQDAARSENLHGHSCTDASDSELVHMLCKEMEWSGAPRPDFLVLDLRFHEGKGPRIVREIRTEFRLADVPLAILTTGGSETEFSALSGAHNTWRMSGVSDPARVVQALRAVLHLWAEVLKLSPSLVREVL